MKSLWNRFKTLVLHGINGVPFDYYLFLFLFLSRMFELLIVGNIFSLFEFYQHAFLLFEKYTYFLTAGYMLLYFLVYFIDRHKLPLNLQQFLAFLFFIVAVISTALNMGRELAYDYFTKLSLMELMMTTLFMFYTASRLSEEQFRKLVRITGKSVIYIVLFFNIISLLVYFINPSASSFNLFGISIECPKVFFDSTLIRKYYRYAGFYRNTNTLGNHCALALVLSVYLIDRKEIKPFIMWMTTFTSVIMIVLARTRTGFLLCALTTAITLGVLIRRKASNARKAFRWYCWLIAAGIIIVSALAVRKIIPIYNAANGDLFYALDRFGSSRMRIYAAVWEMFKAHPIIGSGWNTKIWKYENAHNFLLTVLSWTGLIGLCLMMLLLISTIRKGLKNKTIQNNIFLFLIPLDVFVQCMLEQGIIADARHAYTYMFWLVLGYFAADHAKRGS